MSEKTANLTSISDTDEIGLNSANTPGTGDVFVKCTANKPPPLSHIDEDYDHGVVHNHIVEDAWENDTSIQICLKRRPCNGKGKLRNYPLGEEVNTMAKKEANRRWKILLHFFSDTSLHALPLIANIKRSLYCRVTFWIATIFISLGLMLWALTAVTLQYAEKNTVLYSTQQFNERLRFPAITICNKNLYRKSVIRNAEVNISNVLLTGDYLFADIFGNNSYYNHTTHSAVLYFNSSGHQIEQMLFHCLYAGNRCTVQSFTQRTSTSGNCYTFNSGENGSDVLYGIEGGFMFGLQLILNTEQYEYFLADSDSVGFNVFIHDQDHFPYYGGANSFSISPGQSTQVALRKVEYKLQTPAGGGQCDDEITLKYFDSYSRLSCIVECVTDVVVSTCDCKGQGMPGPAPVCQLNDPCIQRTIAQRIDQERCDCPIACESTVYQKTLSYAKFPSDHIALLLNNSDILSNYPFPDFIISNGTDANGTEYLYLNDNFTESFLSNNFAKVFIYYDELVSTTMEEGLRYTTFQYIADFGGYIGVFTGAGFLTFFEIVDLCYNVIRPIDN